ncbi:MAG: AraC family transcriptional regulator [Spirochaetota bacterium]
MDILSQRLYERREMPVDEPLKIIRGVTKAGEKKIPSHFHSVLELVWFRNGAGGTIVVDGTRYRYKPREAILIRPYAMQSYELASAMQRHILFFLDTSSFLSLFAGSLLEEKVRSFMDRFCALPVVKNTITRAMIDRLSRVTVKNTAAVVSAVLSLEEACASAHNAPKEGFRFARALDYLEKNYHRKIGLGDAAGSIGMSTFYFSREFKRVTGEGFVEFLNRIRLNKAEGLLRYSRSSVTEIARATGFSSLSYFNNAFKRYHRMAPNQFRQALSRNS